MAHLGGSSLFLGYEVGFGHRESIADFGRVLGEYVDVDRGPRQSPPDGRRNGRALHLLGDQRTDRFRPSLPGAGRPVHAPRTGGQAGRAARWPGSATATTSPAAWPSAAARSACAWSWRRPKSTSFDAESLAWIKSTVPRARIGRDGRSGRGGVATQWPFIPTFGRAWARRRKRDPPPRFCRLSGQRRS